MGEIFGLATVHILYYRRDYPSLLQSYTFQTYDWAPKYPTVHKFLRHWKNEITAPIHSITVSHAGGVPPIEVRGDLLRLQ